MIFPAEFIKREPVFQHPEFGRTRPGFEAYTHQSFYGIDSYGRLYDREQAITTAIAMYTDPNYKGIHSWPEGTWEIGKFQWREISYDSYLVTYILLTRNQMTRRTSIWQVAGNTWKIMFHQATPMQP